MTENPPPRSTNPNVRRAQAGEVSAWDRLAAKVGEEARRCLRDKDLPTGFSVEDLEQIVNLEVYRTIARFEPREDGSFRSWVRTILRMRLIDLWKGDRGDKVVPLFDPSDPESPADWLRDDGARRPISFVEQEEGERRMRDVEQHLSERHREVLRLRERGGLSYDEIATRIGLRSGTDARHLFAYARRRRARFMASYFESRADS